jgi:hypothetical protein
MFLNIRYRLTQLLFGVEAILITKLEVSLSKKQKLEVKALKLKIKLFGKSYFFYLKKC